MAAAERPAPPPRRTASAAETEALGAELAAALRPGDVVLLDGEIGAGKTTFVRGALRALGVTGRVTSPTFTLARRYDDARIPASHLDLHRLGEPGPDDLDLLAAETGPGRVAFVEWPPRAAAPLLEGARLAARVRLAHVDPEHRDVTVAR